MIQDVMLVDAAPPVELPAQMMLIEAPIFDEPVALPSPWLIDAVGSWPNFRWPPASRQTYLRQRRFKQASEIASPVCLCCIMFGITIDHSLDQCPYFPLFTWQERRNLMERWNMCFNCWMYDHQSCKEG